MNRRSLLASLAAAPVAAYAPRILAGPLKGFHAYKAGTHQIGLPSERYVQVIFDGIKFDTTGAFDPVTSTWAPVPIGGQETLIRMTAQTYIVGGAGVPGNPSNPQFVLKPVKMNVGKQSDGYFDINMTGVGQPNMGLPGTCSIQFSGNDLAKPGDVYFLIQYSSAAVAPVVFRAITSGTFDLDNNPAHQFWCGEYAT